VIHSRMGREGRLVPVAGLAAVADVAAEAGRLGCAHLLRDDKIVPLG